MSDIALGIVILVVVALVLFFPRNGINLEFHLPSYVSQLEWQMIGIGVLVIIGAAAVYLLLALSFRSFMAKVIEWSGRKKGG